MNSNPTSDEVISYLDAQPLTTSLWWFIENANDEATWRTDVFFRLRERVRESPASEPAIGSHQTQRAKVKPVCSKCGSDNVRGDAYAVWDVDTQSWDVSNVCDKGHACEDCGDSNVKLKWVRCGDDD